MNQHPVTPAPYLLGDRKHIFILTLPKDSEICLPRLSTEDKLAGLEPILKLPFLPYLGLTLLCPRLTLN